MLNNEGLDDYIENLLNILKTEYDGINVDIWVSFKNVGYSKQDGNYVFYDKAKYHYVVLERGVVYQNDETFEESVLAYWLLKHKIRHYAGSFVKKVGVSDEEYTKAVFDKSLEMFSKLGEEFRNIFLDDMK